MLCTNSNSKERREEKCSLSPPFLLFTYLVGHFQVFWGELVVAVKNVDFHNNFDDVLDQFLGVLPVP